MNWQNAHDFCRQHYFELASVHTKDQRAAIDGLCLQAKSQAKLQLELKGKCHIGLQDDAVDDEKIILSGGKGGVAGQSSYHVRGFTVTTTQRNKLASVYNNGNYYHIGPKAKRLLTYLKR